VKRGRDLIVKLEIIGVFGDIMKRIQVLFEYFQASKTILRYCPSK
jgi:hypothetical protein